MFAIKLCKPIDYYLQDKKGLDHIYINQYIYFPILEYFNKRSRRRRSIKKFDSSTAPTHNHRHVIIRLFVKWRVKWLQYKVKELRRTAMKSPPLKRWRSHVCKLELRRKCDKRCWGYYHMFYGGTLVLFRMSTDSLLYCTKYCFFPTPTTRLLEMISWRTAWEMSHALFHWGWMRSVPVFMCHQGEDW